MRSFQDGRLSGSLSMDCNIVLTKMNNLIYYDCAIKGFERSVVAEMVETQEARIKSSSVFYKAKVVSTIFRLDEQFNRVALNSGFFVAGHEYVRDNQQNGMTGNATRTRTGGNGGLILEPVWECVSLFAQAFGTHIKTHASLKLPATKDGSDYGTFLGKRTCDEQSGMSFA